MTSGMLMGLAAYFAAGIVLGAVHFRSLWLFTRGLLLRRRTAPAIAASLGRLALLAAVLTLASRQGALPLLATASGVVLVRSVIVRRLSRVAA